LGLFANNEIEGKHVSHGPHGSRHHRNGTGTWHRHNRTGTWHRRTTTTAATVTLSG